MSYRGLKLVLYIQELGYFEYKPLSLSLRPFFLSPCVCVKILNILKKNKKKKKIEQVDTHALGNFYICNSLSA